MIQSEHLLPHARGVGARADGRFSFFFLFCKGAPLPSTSRKCLGTPFSGVSPSGSGGGGGGDGGGGGGCGNSFFLWP